MNKNPNSIDKVSSIEDVPIVRSAMSLYSNVYQHMALRTEADTCKTDDERITRRLMGLAVEAGESIDILKKHKFQGHPLDRERLAEKLGDVAWYLAVSADAIGYKLSDIFEKNMTKLEKRYPDGFTPERSINRKDE